MLKKKKLTELEITKYTQEYHQLRNDDPDFEAMWKDTEEDFKEWLELNVINVR